MADQIIVLGPWRDGAGEWTREAVSKAPPPGRFDLAVSKRPSPAGHCVEIWRGGSALSYYAATLEAACELADAEARNQGVVLLDAEPGSLTGCVVQYVESWPGRLASYHRAPNTPAIAGYMICAPDVLYRPGAWHGCGWSVRDLEGALIAHGPQTGSKAERLLLAALAALGVDVTYPGRMFRGASRNIVPETE